MQGTILLITLLLMAGALALIMPAVLAVDGPPPSPTASGARTKLLWAMVVIDVVLSVATLRDWPHASAGGDAMVVNISSGQWWWDADAAELPLGREIEFRVTTEDVNHGLGIYDPDMRLVVQVQAMPNYVNSVVYTFEQPGPYQILCMEFCGVAHHDMVADFEVVEAGS